MQKFIIEKIKRKKLAEKEIVLLEKLTSEFDAFYMPKHTDLKYFGKELVQQFRKKLKLKSAYYSINELHVLEFEVPLNWAGKLGFKNHFVLLMLKNGQKLNFRTENYEFWINNKKDGRIKKLFTRNYEQNIRQLIVDELQKIFETGIVYLPEKENILYQVDDFMHFAILAQIHADELVLMAFDIENLEDGESESVKKALFVQTNQRQFILNSEGELFAQSKATRLSLKSSTISWLNYRFSMPKKIKKNLADEIPADKWQVIRYTLVQNSLQKVYLMALHKVLIAKSQNPYDELSYELRKAQQLKDYQEEKIVGLIKKILSDETHRRYLLEWTKEWQLTHDEQFLVIQLFLEYVQEFDGVEDLLQIHRSVRDGFMKNTKNTYEKAFFDLGFCRHLIWADQLQEAREQIENNLKNLPDESIWDLLPANNTDINHLSGQFLKLNYLQLLNRVSIDDEKRKTEAKLAQIQPFNIEFLRKVVNYEDRYQYFYQVLTQAIRETETENFEITATLDEKTAKKLEHSLSAQNKMIKKLQKWVALNDKENYDAIKQYAEKMSEEKHKRELLILNKLKRFYGLENAEIYISYGEKSTEFRVFDDKMPFLLIGKDFLDETNERYLSHKEFAFLSAVEFANLFLGYSYITSTDIWKGATQKSLFVADTLFNIIPFTGALSGVLKGASQMGKIGRWTNFMSKMNQWGQSGIVILKSSLGIVEKLKNKEDKETELLLQSRLMQINADRLGLLVSGDIASCFSAILKTQDEYPQIKELIADIGLLAFLGAHDSDKKMKNKDLTLRLAALSSFYLSEEYKHWYQYFRKEQDNSLPFFYK